MTPEDAARYFTRSDGSYHFARWRRPIAPVIFGVEEETLSTVKGAIEAVTALAGHQMAETDPELGANLMMFFFRDWDELAEIPGLDRLIPDLASLLARLKSAGANQYRLFRFDDGGGIRAAFVFLRMDRALAQVPAADLALAQSAQVMLLWSEAAFEGGGPLARTGDRVILSPEVAGVIRAAYDPVMPVSAQDASHAIRLAARLGDAE